jgi:phosphatidylserine decarboxylase
VPNQLTLKTRLEQFRQARSIHGGLVNLWAAALAVHLSRVPIPSKRLRLGLYKTVYGKKYGALNESELDRPLWAYRSFNSLFTRAVKPELRPISSSCRQLLCPCDGMVQDVGWVRDNKIMTVKGIVYNVPSLLAGLDTDIFRDGFYAIFFLSPRDCHRIFAPGDGQLDEIIHVPGYRLLVHPPFQRKEFPVFTLNERVILRMSTAQGACALVLVAGWGVGNITLPAVKRFQPQARKITRKLFVPPLPVQRGEWIATFELGSTAILLTERTNGVTANVAVEDQVKYGQPAFTFDGKD